MEAYEKINIENLTLKNDEQPIAGGIIITNELRSK